MTPNANRVLDHLGVLDAIVAAAFELRSLDMVDGQHGRTLLSAPWPSGPAPATARLI
jgi:hypothetical protein